MASTAASALAYRRRSENQRMACGIIGKQQQRSASAAA